MADLIIDEDILRRLEAIAEREQRPVNDVLRTLVEKYPEAEMETRVDPLLAMDGMFDDDIIDLSVTVRETMKQYYQKKYDDPD